MTKAWALVTGASAGLGAEYCQLLAADGFHVVLTARRESRLTELATELERQHGISTRTISQDLAEPGAAEALHSKIVAAGIDLSILINNAGFGATGSFVDLDSDRQLQILQVNVSALTALTRLVLPGMITRGFGRILNIGSTAGFQPGPHMAVYYASKAYVNSFSEALSQEVAGTGVTVTLSCPGPTSTEFGQVSGNDRSQLFKLATADARGTAEHGYRAMMTGRTLAIPGLANKLGVQGLRIAPRAAVRRLVSRLNKV